MSSQCSSLKRFATIPIFLLTLSLIAARPPAPNPPDETVFGGPWIDPNNVKVQPSEIAFHRDSLGTYEMESIYFQSIFNDGWICMTSWFVYKYGPIRGWGVYALVVSPQGKRYWTKQELQDKSVKLAEDHLLLLSGKNFLEEKDGVFTLKLDIPDFKCNLTFRNNVPMWRPGDGYAWFDKGKNLFSYIVNNCPWANVEGVIELSDVTLQVTGDGYSDKSRSTTMPTKMAPYLFGLRAYSPKKLPQSQRWFFGILESVKHPSFGYQRIPYMVLGHGDNIVMATKNFDISFPGWKPTPDNKYEYPAVLKVKAAENGWRLEGQFECGDIFDYLDVLAELPVWARRFAKQFLKFPVFVRTYGAFTAVVTAPDGSTTPLNLAGPYEYIVAQ